MREIVDVEVQAEDEQRKRSPARWAKWGKVASWVQSSVRLVMQYRDGGHRSARSGRAKCLYCTGRDNSSYNDGVIWFGLGIDIDAGDECGSCTLTSSSPCAPKWCFLDFGEGLGEELKSQLNWLPGVAGDDGADGWRDG